MDNKIYILIQVLLRKNYQSQEHVFLCFSYAQVVAGGDVSVVTGPQQEPANPSLSFTGLTSSSIFQDDLG